VRDGRDDGGDLQRGNGRIRFDPERCAAGRAADGQREGQASIGQRDRRQPVTELDRARGGGRDDVLEDLERVQRGPGLAAASLRSASSPQP
jgi:hypothetical protein